VMNTCTRVLCLVLFALVGFNLFQVAAGFHASGEVTPTIQLPFYPVAYGIGICCFFQCLVLLCDIIKIRGGKYE